MAQISIEYFNKKGFNEYSKLLLGERPLFFILLTLILTVMIIGLMLLSTNMAAGIGLIVVSLILFIALIIYYERKKKKKKKGETDCWNCDVPTASWDCTDCDGGGKKKPDFDCGPDCDCTPDCNS